MCNILLLLNVMHTNLFCAAIANENQLLLVFTQSSMAVSRYVVNVFQITSLFFFNWRLHIIQTTCVYILLIKLWVFLKKLASIFYRSYFNISLNLIEHLWNMMQRRSLNYCYHYPQTLARFIYRFQTVWNWLGSSTDLKLFGIGWVRIR